MLLEYQQEMPLNLLQRILILLVNYYFQDLNKKILYHSNSNSDTIVAGVLNFWVISVIAIMLGQTLAEFNTIFNSSLLFISICI